MQNNQEKMCPQKTIKTCEFFNGVIVLSKREKVRHFVNIFFLYFSIQTYKNLKTKTEKIENEYK